MLGPEAIAQLGRAYDAAFTIAHDEDSPFADVPVLDLERRLAKLIILAAREGVTDVDQLKARALRALYPLIVAETQSDAPAGVTGP